MAAQKTERDVYEKAGLAGAWDVLKNHMVHPPSFEVFMHGFEQSRIQGDCHSPAAYAYRLVGEFGDAAAA